MGTEVKVYRFSSRAITRDATRSTIRLAVQLTRSAASANCGDETGPGASLVVTESDYYDGGASAGALRGYPLIIYGQ